MLVGKITLVTGAGRGIGRATAETFAKEGATVLVNARTLGSVDKFCEEIAEQYNTVCEPIYFDVSDQSQVKQAFFLIQKKYKRLDVLVNNAGILRDSLFAMTTVDTMDEMVRTNLLGSMYCAQLAARLMSRKLSGSIINISSIMGVHGNSGQVVYSASKAAIIGMSKSLAKEIGHLNIRVNSVAPGTINTDLIKNVPDDTINSVQKSIKMGRIGDPQDVANVCLFLASDLSSYITAQTIGVDGGMII